MKNRPVAHPDPERGQNPSLAELSPQEVRVLQLAMEGLIDKQIAEAMGLSVGTVRVYWKRIRSKSGTTRAESVAMRARRDSDLNYERASRVYEAVLRSTGAAFLTLDGATGDVLRAEAAFTSLLGASDTELVGRSIVAWVPELKELPSSTHGKPVAIMVRDDQGRGRSLMLLGDRASIFVLWAQG